MQPPNNVYNYVEGNVFDYSIDLKNNILNWQTCLKTANKKYFTFQIDPEGTLCIIPSSQKPFKQHSALKTLNYLKKIFFVCVPENEYLRQNVIHLVDFIKENYFTHKNCFSSCFSTSTDTQVALVCGQICNRLTACPALELYPDIFKHIFSFLSLKDLCRFEGVNRAAFKQAKWAWEVFAQTMHVHATPSGQTRYNIMQMGRSLNRLIGSKFFPCQVVRKTPSGTVDMGLTLQRLRNSQSLLNRAFYNSLATYDWDKDWKDFLFLGAHLIGRFDKGHSTFLRAIEYKNDKVFKKILTSRNFDVNEADDYGTTAAHLVAGSGNVDDMSLLINYGANLNVCNYEGMNPLHIACRKGRRDMVKFLLKNNVEVNIRDNAGKNPLFYALHTAAICKDLLNAGAFSNICLVSNYLMTPLHFAIYNGNIDTIYVLLEAGVDVNISNAEGITPLHLAVTEANVKVLSHYNYEPYTDSYIIENEITQYKTYREVLLFTIEIIGNNNMIHVIEKLISKGANINVQDVYGRTPLDLSHPKEQSKYIGREVKALRNLLRPISE